MSFRPAPRTDFGALLSTGDRIPLPFQAPEVDAFRVVGRRIGPRSFALFDDVRSIGMFGTALMLC
jgi:hypothetical protein